MEYIIKHRHTDKNAVINHVPVEEIIKSVENGTIDEVNVNDGIITSYKIKRTQTA